MTEDVVLFMDASQMRNYLRGMKKLEKTLAQERKRISRLIGSFNECIAAASLPGMGNDFTGGGQVNTDTSYKTLARAYRLREIQVEEYVKASCSLYLKEEKLKTVCRCIRLLPEKWSRILIAVFVDGIAEEQYASAKEIRPAGLRKELGTAVQALLALYNSQSAWLRAEYRDMIRRNGG